MNGKCQFLSCAASVALLLVGYAAEPYRIVVPEKPRAFETSAAQELCEWVGKVASDGRVSVEGRDGVVFHVGETDFAKSHGLGAETFKDEEWCIRSFGRDVVLTGGGRRGALYAVAHFLEDECGIRFWMEDEIDVPAAKPLSFGRLDRRGRPFFRRRIVFRANGADPRIAVRCRLNGNGFTEIPPAWGGEGMTHGGAYHSHVWDRYLPFRKYGKEHPEWYSLKGGKRVGGQSAGQLCLTCPGLADVFAEKIEAYIPRDAEKAAKADVDAPVLYTLSPNDNHYFCTCESCREEIGKYGMSGYILRFQNAVAERVHRKYPHVRFSISAYHDTEDLPKGGVLPQKSMVVKVCNTQGNLNTSPREKENAVMQKRLREWGSLVDEINVHEYMRTFSFQVSGLPLPSEFAIVDRVRYYGENKVTGGLFEMEGAEWTDMYELKFYLLRRALEDPSVDSDALIHEFTDRFYGAAGADVLAMRRYLEKVRRASGDFVRYSPFLTDFDCFTVDVLTKAGKMLDEAERKVSDDAVRLARVKRARTSIDRLLYLRKRFSTFSPPEPGVSDVPFLDFPVDRTMWCPYPHSDTKFADDPEAVKGLSVRVGADGKLRERYGFPFAAGFRADWQRKAAAGGKGKLSSVTIDKAKGPGYQWYELGEITVPEGDLLVWMTRMWTIQFKLLSPGLVGRKCRVRLHMKLTGPAFHPDATGESRIDIDRLVFIPVADAVAGGPTPQDVPELLVSERGERIADAEGWEKVRRPEILEFFRHGVYGRRPVQRPPHLAFSAAEPDRIMMDGAAVRKRIRVEYGGSYGTNAFVFTAFVPTAAKGPSPSFVFICNRDPKENIDPERVNRSGFWPAEEIVRRGFAAIAFFNGDVTPDSEHGRRLGAFAAFEDVDLKYRSYEGWGVLSCWAWGASRVLDWIETESSLDARRVAVIGHSRGGKTALVAAAEDPRFALACSSCSGCGGAKLHHIDLPDSETIVKSNVSRRFWYCNRYVEWTNRDREMPYDQHEYVALIAPRLVCIGSATDDDHAGPLGEYWTARLASPAWELYGKRGLVSDSWPAPDTPQQDGCIGYHRRTGKHDLTPYDWGVYMDFAERHGLLSKR